MNDEQTTRKKIASLFVHPRGDPYRQARQLLMLGITRDHWLMFYGLGSEEPAWCLANSLDALIQRGVRNGNMRMTDYRPCGIGIFGLHHIVQYADYQHWDLHRKELRTAYIRAEQNSYRQVREIVFSGIASKACIILHGPHEYIRELLHPLNDTIMRGSYNGIRIVEPRPLGIFVHIRNTLFKFADYSQYFTYRT